MGDRCTGHCCRFFSIGSPEEFNKRVARILDDPEIEEAVKKETLEVKAMVLFRGMMKNPFSPKHGATSWDMSHEHGHWWTCKNLVEHEDGSASCGIYETRPTMCRRFPNGQQCPYPCCTWEAAREKPPIPVDRLTRYHSLRQPLVLKGVLVEETISKEST